MNAPGWGSWSSIQTQHIPTWTLEAQRYRDLQNGKEEQLRQTLTKSWTLVSYRLCVCCSAILEESFTFTERRNAKISQAEKGSENRATSVRGNFSHEQPTSASRVLRTLSPARPRHRTRPGSAFKEPRGHWSDDLFGSGWSHAKRGGANSASHQFHEPFRPKPIDLWVEGNAATSAATSGNTHTPPLSKLFAHGWFWADLTWKQSGSPPYLRSHQSDRSIHRIPSCSTNASRSPRPRPRWLWSGPQIQISGAQWCSMSSIAASSKTPRTLLSSEGK